MLFLSLMLLAAPLFVSAHGGHGHHHHDHHDHHHGAETSPSGEDVHSTWGQYAWRSLAEGKAESAATGKPMLLLVWKTWCGACKSLRPRFASSSAIAAEASNFVMVNVVDDEEPADALYKPEDAGYSACQCSVRLQQPRPPPTLPLTPSPLPSSPPPVPRILFFDKSHKLMDVSSGNDKYKFFYGEDGAIAGAMRRAAAKAAAAAPPAELASEDL